MDPVDRILYTTRVVKFECRVLKFLFAKPYVYFHLITKESSGHELISPFMGIGSTPL
jgi:hypothetical protein